MRTADGVETTVCCKSGASFTEIGDMIVETANHDKLNGIVMVGGTKEAMGNVSIDELKERTQLLITKAKSVAEAATVGSVLPWCDHDPERLAKVNGANRTYREEVWTECWRISLCLNGRQRKRKDNPTHAATHAVSHRRCARDYRRRCTRMARRSRTTVEHTTGHTPCHTVGGHEREHRRRPTGLARRQPSSEHTTRHTQWHTVGGQERGHRWRASNWFVVNRRSTARHTMGQCAKCGETNHVTARCSHRDKVQCHVCVNRGHKEKHRTELSLGLWPTSSVDWKNRRITSDRWSI